MDDDATHMQVDYVIMERCKIGPSGLVLFVALQNLRCK